jgi:hypothetical protein
MPRIALKLSQETHARQRNTLEKCPSQIEEKKPMIVEITPE